VWKETSEREGEIKVVLAYTNSNSFQLEPIPPNKEESQELDALKREEEKREARLPRPRYNKRTLKKFWRGSDPKS